eukprot:CAMPEP_0184483198 /NCGR_PEP_ID=MMETSP0113_2-20130426/4839_1 /TAXON_ID=91329 /ORGANISM="Norrisiella sphaerica, Strain BC52" /LENGTH=101 /DNA_ID=CAMNT_0026863455 /DNA_START=145 /DNA_END=450 /DNA_ORIENTATION=+
MRRIIKHAGVQDVIITDKEAKLIYHDSAKEKKNSMSTKDAQKYASNLAQLTTQARSVVRDLDPQNDLSFFRIRSKKHEIMVAPDKDFMLMVIQNPSATEEK